MWATAIFKDLRCKPIESSMVRVTTCLTLVLLAACNAGADRATDSTVPPSRSDTSSATIPSTSIQTAALQTVAPSVAALDAQTIILAVDDLPTGWFVVPGEPQRASAHCLDRPLEARGLSFAVADRSNALATYAQSTLGPFVSVAVSVGVPSSVELFQDLSEDFGSCDGSVDSEGSIVHVRAASSPSIGDESFVLWIEYDTGISVSLAMGWGRVGDTIVMTTSTVVGGTADLTLVEQALSTMIDRIPEQ